MSALYCRRCPGLMVYNAVMGVPDQLLSSSVAHLQEAYTVDVIGATVVAQMAAPAMQAAGSGTIIVTGGGSLIIPSRSWRSLPRQGGPPVGCDDAGADLEADGIRVATLTILGQIVAGTAFDPARIAERYWEVVHLDGPWQAESVLASSDVDSSWCRWAHNTDVRPDWLHVKQSGLEWR